MTALAILASAITTAAAGGCGPGGSTAVSGSSPSPLGTHYQGLPAGVTAAPGLVDSVAWGGRGQLALVTWGSSDCPRLPVKMDATPDNAVTVTMSAGQPPAGQTCRADLTGTTSVVELPAAIDTGQPVVVTISDGENGTTVTLPPQGAS